VEDKQFSVTLSFNNVREKLVVPFDSIISFAPGIPLYFPKIHPILKICKDTNATLACDIEILYRENYLNNFFIGITGTNGKSTVTALTGFVMLLPAATKTLYGSDANPTKVGSDDMKKLISQ
jgi:UDP-N-acetylmuramoylalanine-D-glutamate ligase